MEQDKNRTKRVGECCEECIHDNPSADRVCLTCPCHKDTKQVGESLREEIEDVLIKLTGKIVSQWTGGEILSLLKQKLEGVVGEELEVGHEPKLPCRGCISEGINQKREEVKKALEELLK